MSFNFTSLTKTASISERETFKITFGLLSFREDQNFQTFHTGTEIKHKDVESRPGILNKRITLYLDQNPNVEKKLKTHN